MWVYLCEVKWRTLKKHFFSLFSHMCYKIWEEINKEVEKEKVKKKTFLIKKFCLTLFSLFFFFLKFSNFIHLVKTVFYFGQMEIMSSSLASLCSQRLWRGWWPKTTSAAMTVTKKTKNILVCEDCNETAYWLLL